MQQARIILASGSAIEMTAAGENAFAGTIEVAEPTTYHIELTSREGERYLGSNEYDITVLEDRPPVVTLERPGRDTRATSVEEIFTLARAEDDYGVVSLDLHFSVNGGEEKNESATRTETRTFMDVRYHAPAARAQPSAQPAA